MCITASMPIYYFIQSLQKPNGNWHELWREKEYKEVTENFDAR